MENNMHTVLDLVFRFQTEAQKVKRYEKNPFVVGDNVAEHLARAQRLLVYITPDLKKEFPDQKALIEETFVCITLHDDDEILVGFDIPTAIKVHDENNNVEIESFTDAVSVLPFETKDFLISAFSSFRNKSSLPAKIAKALDNITGNQLVVEQKIGLINPDLARFCIEYTQKVTGISKTIDLLVSAQIEQIVEFRNFLKNNELEIEQMIKILGQNNSEKIRKLIKIDVMSHELDKSKVYTEIEEL